MASVGVGQSAGNRLAASEEPFDSSEGTQSASSRGKLFRTAIWYSTALGWSVLPLAPRSKLPLISKRRGGKGVHDATTDPAQIEEWWAKDPRANVGLAAGHEWWALDVDTSDGKDGLVTLGVLQIENGGIPDTVTQRTGGGGWQYLFQADPRLKNRVNANKLAGLDVRAPGGYIVAPPSIHPDTGLTYLWEPGFGPHQIGLARAPEWLIEALAPKPEPEPVRRERRPIRTAEARSRYVRAAVEKEVNRLFAAGKGSRNHTLFSVGCRLYEFVGSGELSADYAEDFLIGGAEHLQLSADEYRKTIRSAKEHGLAKPRALPQ